LAIIHGVKLIFGIKAIKNPRRGKSPGVGKDRREGITPYLGVRATYTGLSLV
jgi:hypothetical protein